MLPHFIKQDELALSSMCQLVDQARGEVSTEMASVHELTDRPEAELPQTLEEHRRIVSQVRCRSAR